MSKRKSPSVPAESTPDPKASVDPVPRPITTFVELYAEHFGSLVFPQPGGQAIDLELLREASASVRASAKREHDARVELDDAREALAEHQRELLSVSERALAYARVFASDSPELLSELAALQIGARPVRAKRSRRKRKPPRADEVTSTDSQLRLAEGQTAEPDAA